MDLRDTTAIMSVILKQGGLGTGGLNFDCKVRRESVEPVDLFIGHIAAMDCYALGLRKAAAMQHEMQSMVDERYLSWSVEAIAQKIVKGEATLEECTQYAKENGPPVSKSAKQELYEAVRNRYISG